MRYEWRCPAELLHMNAKRHPRFRRPGHAVTGDRTRTWADKREALGHDHSHGVVDDHWRLAYGELSPTSSARNRGRCRLATPLQRAQTQQLTR